MHLNFWNPWNPRLLLKGLNNSLPIEYSLNAEKLGHSPPGLQWPCTPGGSECIRLLPFPETASSPFFMNKAS